MSDTAIGGRYRQSDALREILEWSKERDPWQRDALRQLINGASVEDIELERLEDICTGARDDAIALQEEHLAREVSNEQSVSLTKVSGASGVNALASNQELSFAANGITIIYGDNGSGKSGYCRVLKHACRSRDRKFSIHPDIGASPDTTQSAIIEYQAGTTVKTVNWTPDLDTDVGLGQVSIFDSRSANTHVQAENSVAYTPMPMRILEGLGDICDHLKLHIDNKITAIENQTPRVISQHRLSATTAPGKYVSSLSAKSDLGVLNLLSTLTEPETRRLDTLRADLAQDPKQTIRRYAALKIPRQWHSILAGTALKSLSKVSL